MRVLVLGCGPAGLMAAWAAKQLGHEVSIASRKVQSTMYGAQYLHAMIPGIPVQKTTVHYVLDGSPQEYRKKVYGDMWDGTVSPEDLNANHEAWDIRGTYDALWHHFEDTIHHEIVDAGFMREALGYCDLVINSIPRNVLCYDGHTFGGTSIWAAGEAPEIGIKLPYYCPDDTVLCTGDPERSWYRLSNIFGRKTVEWPDRKKPPLPGIAKVTKPTNHQCSCWPTVLHVGRYGRWEKGVLSHSAYFDTRTFLETDRGE